MNTFFSIALFFCCHLYSLGQTISISGQVIDDDTEEAMPFCGVYVWGTSTGVLTDIDGYYTIELAPNTGDSLATNSLGYDKLLKKFNKNLADQVINFRMRSSALELGVDIVVRAGENPANDIIRQINKHKKKNDINHCTESYRAEIYSKVELDLVNITSAMKDMKIFKKLQFIFDNIDTVSDVKPFLPAYVAEKIYDSYALKGKERKDIIKAQRVSAVKNQTVIEFIGSMNSEYNIYNNTILLLGKEFISPFSVNGLNYYKYYIIDSTMLKGKWCYKLKFTPKDKTGNTFYGDFWVSMSDYALLIVNMRMNPEANVNLVSRILIYQEYDPYKDQYWLPKKQKTIIDFTTNKNSDGLGIIGRKTISYKDFSINTVDAADIYKAKDPEDIKYEQLEQSDTFWQDNRHESLSSNEAGVYGMVDSVQNIPIFKTLGEIVQIIVGGFKVFGPIKIGPYSNLFTWNDVEGVRLSLGISTSTKFSKKIKLYGYAGYGFGDKRWKYGGDVQYVFNRYRRSAIGLSFVNDASFENRNSEERKTQSLFAGWLRRAIPQKIMYIQEGKFWFKHTWKKGLSNKIAVLHRRINPVGFQNSTQGGLNFKFLMRNANNTSTPDTVRQIRSTEIVLNTRFAYKERIISGAFRDFSMGSKYPIIDLTYTLGIRGILGAQFRFHKIRLGIEHWFYISPVGWIEYQLEIGKIFGTLPYLLLESHPGNEAYFYNKTSFNSMNSFEFVSDFYVHARIEHHWEGFLLNRIPFVRKWLKWRMVTALRASWGTLSTMNQDANRLNHYDRSIKSSKDRTSPFGEGPFYGSFDKGPYVEVSAGIENIFQFIRVDALWRLNYLDNRDAQPFSVRVTLNFDF